MTTVRAAFEDVPVFFPAAGNDLFGVLTLPNGEPARGAVVLLQGARYTVSSGRNQVNVRLARRLVEEGWAVLRFDYHGIGDSSGRLEGFRLDRPFMDDLRGAVDAVTGHGIEGPIVLVGDCYGARLALAGAGALPAVGGSIAVAMPLMDSQAGEGSATRMAKEVPISGYLKKAVLAVKSGRVRDRRRWRAYLLLLRVKARTSRRKVGRFLSRRGSYPMWMSRSVLEAMEATVRRGVPVVFLYGEEEHDHELFREALSAGGLTEMFTRSGSLLRLATTEKHLHAIASERSQYRFITAVSAWVERLAESGELASGNRDEVSGT